MDIDLNEEQEMLKKMARGFLTTKCPGTLVRQMMEDERGYPPELWDEIVGLGWLGLAFPPAYGGEGGSFLDLTILLEEMGRVCFPGPFFSTIVLGGLPILFMGSEEQKKRLLPKLCKGKLVATMALTEPDFRYDPGGVSLKAVPAEGGYVLSGTKLFVTDAHVADTIVTVARTGKGKGGEGITVFLVDARSPGLGIRQLKPVDGTKQYQLDYENVKVSAQDILGEAGKGWAGIDKILQYAAVARSAEMLGGAQKVLELSIQYANERQQFRRFIGTFQAIQHHCANMATDVDGMRLTTYQAAWMLAENVPCRREVAIAKGWASEAYKRVAFIGLRVHGGMGFIEDHDVSIFYRRALTYDASFGNAEFHRNALCQELHV